MITNSNTTLRDLKSDKEKNLNDTSNIKLVKKQGDNFMGNLITYDVIECSYSFFSYISILNALQLMESVPLEEDLVYMRLTSMGWPSYIP